MKKELTIEEHLEKICDWFDAGCYVDNEAQEMIQDAQEALKQAKTLSKADVSRLVCGCTEDNLMIRRHSGNKYCGKCGEDI